MKTFGFNMTGNKPEFVESLKYFGHVIDRKFSVYEDIKKEICGKCMRGNPLVMNYKFCTGNVKRFILKIIFYSAYCVSLWRMFSASTLQRFKLCYNTIMRTMLGYSS